MQRRHSILALAAIAAAAPASPPEAAQDAAAIAAAFGRRESVQQISLSPDGARIAVVAPTTGRGAALLVARLDNGQLKPILRTSGDPDQLRRCEWSTATRLVCTTSAIVNGAQLLGFTRLFSLDADGSNLKQLSARDSSRALGVVQNGGSIIDWLGEGGGEVLMTRAYVPESTIGTHLASSRNGLGVERVNTTTLQRSMVEQPNGTAVEYITDGNGVVRIRGLLPQTNAGYDGTVVNYSYRAAGSREWRPLGKLDLVGRQGFNPYAVDRALDVVYGFDRDGGRQALYKVALDGSAKRELVFAHPHVDVDGLIQVGRQHRVVGVSFATERREIAFFDPELKKLGAALSRALPGLPLVSFIDASADEKTLLLWAGSDVDPGRYYRYDKGTRKLEELLPVRPELASVKLAPVKPVSFAAADGTPIPGYLTLPVDGTGRGLPAVVLPHGGPGARDEWGFDWLAQFFAARGFAVLQPNFRGSAGYGADWFQKNGFQSWRTAIGDVDDGGRWLVKQGIADPNKLAIVGWSYGGYAALQSAVLDPGLFKAIIAIAPVTDLETLRNDSRRYSNFVQVDRFIGAGPHVRQGSPAQNARAITAPVLLFHGDRDQNVAIGQSRLMTDRLRDAGKKVDYVEFKGLDHQLDDNEARTQLLTKADAFLRASMGM